MEKTGKEYKDNKGNVIEILLLGFVAGIKYNSEGTELEWLYNKEGCLTGYREGPKIFKTEQMAQKFLNNREHVGKPYARKYFYHHYKEEEGNG